MSIEEKRKLNEQHPDIKDFWDEVDKACKEFEVNVSRLETKYNHPLSQNDAFTFAHETIPYNRILHEKIKKIQKKYSYLYEKE